MSTDVQKRSEIWNNLELGIVEHLEPKEIAQARERWATGTTKQDRLIMKAYETAENALVEGRKMVDLNTVLMRGGLDYRHLPQLAIAPVLAKKVTVLARRRGEATYRARSGMRTFSLSVPISGWAGNPVAVRAAASTPAMPPDIRALARRDHLVLWQASWKQVRTQNERPVRDPALLEHVAGNLYVVVATWDLTELEANALM